MATATKKDNSWYLTRKGYHCCNDPGHYRSGITPYTSDHPVPGATGVGEITLTSPQSDLSQCDGLKTLKIQYVIFARDHANELSQSLLEKTHPSIKVIEQANGTVGLQDDYFGPDPFLICTRLEASVSSESRK
ncbi:hypothetical protein PV08_06450 [Exophiala spinifera]|uniref:Uncharacterized protein n=1 Tax=Exophiala spinifera TaxID=91928 RepID=A0A0D2BBK9_9EURO|nr:uncharacterized protein PV08_06450 [Exophiala spinifera]KIW16398.1 hypothetical protein PV08_06450 [Exophiala spinifera]